MGVAAQLSGYHGVSRTVATIVLQGQQTKRKPKDVGKESQRKWAKKVKGRKQRKPEEEGRESQRKKAKKVRGSRQRKSEVVGRESRSKSKKKVRR